MPAAVGTENGGRESVKKPHSTDCVTLERWRYFPPLVPRPRAWVPLLAEAGSPHARPTSTIHARPPHYAPRYSCEAFSQYFLSMSNDDPIFTKPALILDRCT